MPNLVVYVPAATWRAIERLEGASVKEAMRDVCGRALREYLDRRLLEEEGVLPLEPVAQLELGPGA